MTDGPGPVPGSLTSPGATARGLREAFDRSRLAPGGPAARLATLLLAGAVLLLVGSLFVTWIPGAWYPVTATCALLALPATLHPARGRAVLALVVAVWAAAGTVGGVVQWRAHQELRAGLRAVPGPPFGEPWP